MHVYVMFYLKRSSWFDYLVLELDYDKFNHIVVEVVDLCPPPRFDSGKHDEKSREKWILHLARLVSSFRKRQRTVKNTITRKFIKEVECTLVLGSLSCSRDVPHPWFPYYSILVSSLYLTHTHHGFHPYPQPSH